MNFRKAMNIYRYPLVLLAAGFVILAVYFFTGGASGQEGEINTEISGAAEMQTGYTESITDISDSPSERSSTEIEKTDTVTSETVDESIQKTDESEEAITEAAETENESISETDRPEEKTAVEPAEDSKTVEETENETLEHFSSEAELTESEAPETDTAETKAPFVGVSIQEGPVKELIRQGLRYVQARYGYSLSDRVGAGGNFDCSGFAAVLLMQVYGCSDFYCGGNAFSTSDWRNYGAQFQIGDVVYFGSQPYIVTMKDTEDYLQAWSVPGSIVVQYSPVNVPEKTMGHISIALGNMPYKSTEEVVSFLASEYGVDLSGTTITGLPMVYDQYGPDAGHTIWKINAQSVANCVIVDNNFASDPSWIEPVSIVFEPVFN